MNNLLTRFSMWLLYILIAIGYGIFSVIKKLTDLFWVRRKILGTIILILASIFLPVIVILRFLFDSFLWGQTYSWLFFISFLSWVITTIYVYDKGIKIKRKNLVLLPLLIFLIIGPLFYLSALSYASQLQTTDDKVIYVNTYAHDHIIWFGGIPLLVDRGTNAAFGFLPSYFYLGFGACGEYATLEKGMLDSLGIASFQVTLAEDHQFVMVQVNNTWWVSDPSLGPTSALVNPKEYAESRINDPGVGGFTLAISAEGSPPNYVVTDMFVNTDNAIIKVVKDGSPYSLGDITLAHYFLGTLWNFTFPLNQDGIVSVKLGDMHSPLYQGAPQYWVFVDGKNSTVAVTSYGTNSTVEYIVNINSTTVNK